MKKNEDTTEQALNFAKDLISQFVKNFDEIKQLGEKIIKLELNIKAIWLILTLTLSGITFILGVGIERIAETLIK